MSKTMTMPLSGKIIEVVYNNQIEIIWQGGHLQPTYSYRWEVDGEDRNGLQGGHVFQALRANDPEGQMGEA